MGLIMCGMRCPERRAHDEHDAEEMHSLSSDADVEMPVEKSASRWGPGCQKTSVIQRPDRTYITELHHADFSKLTDATVGRLRLEEELSQRHFFTSEELPHVADGRERSAPRNLWKLNMDSAR